MKKPTDTTTTAEKMTFGGIYIPREVFNSDISPMAKLLYGVIQCLDGNNGCYASNAYLADVCNISESTVKDHISALVDAKFVYRREADNGYRILTTFSSLGLAKPIPREAEKSATPSQKIGYPPAEKSATNIQDINTEKRQDTGTDGIVYPHGEEFMKAWNTWMTYRKERKKPMTTRTINMQLEELNGLTEQQAIATINQSIKNGWIGLFALQGQFKVSNHVTTKAQHKNGF
jgi:DNA-binding Lrp family transcriptional regulator